MSRIKVTNLRQDSATSDNISLDSSGNVAFQAGTASAPSLHFTGDTNTGIYAPAADSVAVVTGGSARTTVDSSGRLLVGTTTARVVGYNGGSEAPIQVERPNDLIAGINLIQHRSGDTIGPYVRFAKTRGSSVGDTTVVQSGDEIGGLQFCGADGTDLATAGASIIGLVDGTPGSNDMPGRLQFRTTADGASSPTTRLTIKADGAFRDATGVYLDATSNSANLTIDSAGHIQRSTSSIKYKTDVENIETQYSEALLQCRPVWYRSTTQSDNSAHSFWGFIAEEVADIDPRLVHWKTTKPIVQENGSLEHVPCEPEPEGVAYDRFVPHLLNLIKRQKEQLETQAASIASLEARLTALEG